MAPSTSSTCDGSGRTSRARCSRTRPPVSTSRAIPGFRRKAGMNKQWENFGPRVGLAWDPTGNGTHERAGFLRQIVRVRERAIPSQHLGRAALGIRGAAQRPARRPGQSVPGEPGRADQHLSGHVRPERAVLAQWTVSQPEQRHDVHHRAYVERHGRTAVGPNWLVSAGYVGSRTNNIWESTPLNNALFVTVNGAAPSAANLNARRPFTLADPANGQYYGPLDMYVDRRQAALQGHAAVGAAERRPRLDRRMRTTPCRTAMARPTAAAAARPTWGSATTCPSDPGFDDGNCTADRLHNFSMTAGVESPRFENAALRAVASGWRLVGSFRALTGPWLTIDAGTDRALERAGGHAAGKPDSRRPVRRSVQQSGRTAASGS